MSKFCPELQLPWALKALKFQSLEHISIEVQYGINKPTLEKDCLNRHVTDIMSFPSMHTVLAEATFDFNRCLSISIHDELLTSTDTDSPQKGQTFLQVSDSELLKLAKQVKPTSSIYHYRIVLIDQIVDVISEVAPKVTLVRSPQEPFTAGFLQRITETFTLR